MCLAIPVKIKAINGTEAVVEAGGVIRRASLMLTPEARTGDYVLLHAGYAINIVDRAEAERTLELFAEIAGMTEEE